jgi:hypothetical protein
MIPLVDQADSRQSYCVGVVSIDSKKPYQFWPGAWGDDLVVKLDPYCAWLMLLLGLTTVHKLPCSA